ncbi:MAG TPA: peptidoglycan DD-metalloendopeptidase family protein [Plantibacter sp.]|uniref:M23 family metallopeptidase n=1 Tax=unclassified Plantibacter TaxID=2624265 RepID=UPI002CA7D363|nr:peptidoglycan DD-metalloendopeptidase family protein [Plantibacter sp.]
MLPDPQDPLNTTPERESAPAQTPPLSRRELRERERQAAAESIVQPVLTSWTSQVQDALAPNALGTKPLLEAPVASVAAEAPAATASVIDPVDQIIADAIDAVAVEAVEETAPVESEPLIADPAVAPVATPSTASVPVDTDVPVVEAPRVRRSAPVRPATKPRASTAAASGPARPTRTARKRRITTKIFAGAAMGFVALMAVATSVPANALLTAEDVASSVAAASQAELGDGNGLSNQASQSLDSEGSAELTFTRDDYTTSTIEEAAAAMGIRPANTFTNDPNGTIQWPFAVGVTIGDRFGARDCAGCSSDHHGQDFNPGDGAPIQVIADGVVRHVEDGEGSLGVNIIVDHTINGQLVSSVYAHMQHGSTKVVEGQVIKVGTIIGLTGSTGMSTGPHLHFEIRLDGVTWVDPLEWLYANVN